MNDLIINFLLELQLGLSLIGFSIELSVLSRLFVLGGIILGIYCIFVGLGFFSFARRIRTGVVLMASYLLYLSLHIPLDILDVI